MRGSVSSTVWRPSVCPSVCPIDRQQQRRPAGLLLRVLCTGDINRRLRCRVAANAGSVMLRTDEGGLAPQTCYGRMGSSDMLMLCSMLGALNKDRENFAGPF